ncbi:AAA family ATPase [Cyanobacterium aponinum]|uniref:AAA family ATPase n=1 Tax=Cyanobacterium aponinum TaxID=379064 RepID=UPI000C12C817|nr:AAA family ATPase [Cyanobacterium aponinum]PHV63206.1 hypothetical protein CSQ80_06635 [Cyanobacterium aponinum IPPAS B-1201]
MIITDFNDKKAELNQIFSWLELTFKSSIINSSQDLIRKLEYEKTKDFSNIEFLYTPTTKVNRYWFKEQETKSCPPSFKKGKEWINGTGEISQWLPYRNKDIKHCKNAIALIHEGEKATEYARSIGLVSFSFLGAKSQNMEFLKQQLSWLKENGLKGAIYVIDNDPTGEKKADKIRKAAFEINFPLLCVPINLLFSPCHKGDDFADLVKAMYNPQRQNYKQIKRIIEECIEENLSELIDKEIEKLDTATITIEEAKEKLELLFKQNLNESDLIVSAQKLYARLEHPMSKTQWKNLIDALKQEYKKERAKLDLQLYLQAEDIFEQIAIKQRIQTHYGYSNADFYRLVHHIEQLEKTPKKQLWTIADLVRASQQQEDWLLPSFLPQGELLLISALSKVGKSLLATEISNAVLRGGKFLDEPVKKGKVLYCFSDESSNDFGGRVFNLGLDLPEILPEQENLMGLSYFDIRNLKQLEIYLEDFRPSLVVFDSLTSISFGVKESENDAEFSRNIYQLKDLLKKYNCSGILIHHNNKQGGISGSERIKAACWGTAQLEMSGGTLVDEDEEGNETTNFTEDYRFLKLNNTRSTESCTYKLLLNPTQEWINKGIYEFCGDTSDPYGEKREAADKIYRYLSHSGLPLEPVEINQALGLTKPTLYRSLDKLTRSGKIVKRRSHNNPRSWVYQISDNNNLQQDLHSHETGFEKIKNPKKIDPPPRETNETNHETKAKTIDKSNLGDSLTTVSPNSHETNSETNARLTETVANSEIQSDSLTVSPKTRGGGVKKIGDSENDETSLMDNKSYCENLASLRIRVAHFQTQEIMGTITEILSLGDTVSSTLVNVVWDEPRPVYRAMTKEILSKEKEETCWLSMLRSDEVNLKTWWEEQINNG